MRPKSEKCLQWAEKPMETLATQARSKIQNVSVNFKLMQVV